MKSPVHHAQVLPGPIAGVHAEWLHSARDFGRHWHDSHGFGVMDAGGHRSTSGRGAVEAVAGEVITSNPGEVHDGHPLQQAARRWRMIHIAPVAMTRLLGDAEWEFTGPVLKDPRVHAATTRVLEGWPGRLQASTPASSAIWEESLTWACGLLLQHHSNRRPDNPVSTAHWASVRECLLDQMHAPPSLDELASLVGVSRYRLLRQFAKVHGLPPHAWLQQQRLHRASTLIAAGATIAQAAADCGFADQSHFHRHFVRARGYTPGQWQRAGAGQLQ